MTNPSIALPPSAASTSTSARKTKPRRKTESLRASPDTSAQPSDPSIVELAKQLFPLLIARVPQASMADAVTVAEGHLSALHRVALVQRWLSGETLSMTDDSALSVAIKGYKDTLDVASSSLTLPGG